MLPLLLPGSRTLRGWQDDHQVGDGLDDDGGSLNVTDEMVALAI